MSTDIVIDSVQGLMSSQELIEVKPEELDDSEALLVWSVFDAMEKELISKRKSEFKKHLFKLAETKGKQNAKGSFNYAPPGTDGSITKQRRKGKAGLDAVAAEDFLTKSGLDDTLMVGNVTFTRGQLKLLLDVIDYHVQDLFNNGLDAKDAQALYDAIWAVYESKLVVDEKRFEAAVEMGMISLEELKEVSVVGEPTWALVVKKPSVITKLLKGGKK